MKFPERIGKYPIEAILGQGAMGTVYKGFDPHIQRSVAIKTVHKSLLTQESEQASFAARFRNEAQAVGRLQHPNIVAIYEFGEDEASAYIAMEFVEGKSLDQVLHATPLLPEAQALRVMEQLLDALDCAHRHGVWHRDVKPANLILTAQGQVKLTDFGIARIENMGLTQVSSMIGTPGYMAPEQYIGEGIDHRADLFAAGVLLYRLLTGVLPFTGSVETVMYKIMNEQATPPSQLSKDGQAGRVEFYDALLHKALIKDANKRFQSAAEFRQALSAAHRGEAGQGLAEPQGDDQATLIIPQAQWAQAVGAAAKLTVNQDRPFATFSNSPTSSASSLASAAMPTGWDPVALSRIERALAVQLGPMSKLMVRQAAQRCNDMQSLAVELGRHIEQDSKRRDFIREATLASQAAPIVSAPASIAKAASISTATSNAAPDRSGTNATEPLTEAFKAQATAVLSRQIGPIAKIFVKRSADKAAGKADFIRLLIEAAGEADAASLERELNLIA
ncbi:serine/threonine protein kinase [Paucibacter sp. B2R-40]|uniref:serine/threonine-protein kinase n=1 Tax=Paucibacter sp. B2R-40 TaxID=2893554 RepID=UPI0021E466E4|nr:serine/threonine-protein kinase [Paucibacter sp. B2R-40]MCV2355936.1 serine/threonine protein kinase [Paucibacter sp. B2R-40]